jgi:CheY-like chemotaxis protein
VTLPFPDTLRVGRKQHTLRPLQRILDAMVSKDGQQSSDPTQPGASQAPRSLCIVVADDDRDAVLTLQMLLRDEGHEVHAAYDAKEALDQVLKHDPDVLILDIVLGRGSGFEVAKTVRARHGEGRPIIVGLSGVYKKGSDKILADINGFNHYLVKPYDPKALVAVLAPLREPRRRVDDGHETPARTYRAALAHAAGVLGGVRELSDRLQVPMSDLTRWLAGQDKPSIGVFLRVIDILLEERNKSHLELQSGQIITFPGRPEPTDSA